MLRKVKKNNSLACDLLALPVECPFSLAFEIFNPKSLVASFKAQVEVTDYLHKTLEVLKLGNWGTIAKRRTE